MIENCHKMAQLASLAYMDGPEAKPKMKELGYTTHKFIDIKGAQCHIVSNKEEVVICFRGTEPTEISDVLADLNAWPDRAKIGGRVHNGFQNELEKVWDEVLKTLDKIKLEGKNLFICGHSLGGAMATVCASRLHDKVTCLYTYGSPRVGTRGFINRFKHVLHYRHVNNNDIVTRVPPWFMFYKHHGTLRYINYFGNIRKMTPWQRIKDKIRGYRDGILDGVKDHDMAKYIKGTDSTEYPKVTKK